MERIVRPSRLTRFLRCVISRRRLPGRPGSRSAATGPAVHTPVKRCAAKPMAQKVHSGGGGDSVQPRATVSVHRWTLDGSTRGGLSRRQRVGGEPLASCFPLLSTTRQACPPPPPTLAGWRDRKSRPSTNRRRARARARPRPRPPFPPPPFPPYFVTATQSTGLHGVSRAVVVTAPPSAPPIGRR